MQKKYDNEMLKTYVNMCISNGLLSECSMLSSNQFDMNKYVAYIEIIIIAIETNVFDDIYICTYT